MNRAQLWRDIFVRRLLMRQDDVEADGNPARIARTTVACLHHARTTAGDDDVVLMAIVARGHDPRKFTRLIVIFRQLSQGLGLRRLLFVGRRNAGAAEEHDGAFAQAV